jgi:uncharacterized delta-60 repeat protein
MSDRAPFLARVLLVASMIAIAAGTASSSPVRAASASSVVGATVLSSTDLQTTLCRPATAGRTSFGAVPTSTSIVTTNDCRVSFGSSNSIARLRVRQADQTGVALHTFATGTLDASFDGPSGTGNGEVQTPIPGAGSFYSPELHRLPDGRILVAADGGSGGVHLARFDANGVLDPTFDGDSGTANGNVFVDPGAGPEYVIDLFVLDDGGILVVTSSGADVLLLRFLADGRLDTAFDGVSGTGNGLVRLTRGTGIRASGSAVIDDTGRLVFSAEYDTGPDYELTVARVDADTGLLDPTFDGPSGTGNGFVDLPTGSSTTSLASTIQEDGRIVVIGVDGVNQQHWFRLDPASGTFDTTFDGPSGTDDGHVQPGAISATYYAVVEQQSDGKLLFAQSGNLLGGGISTLVRMRADGTLDPTFDGPTGTGDGIVSIFTNVYEMTSAVLQPDDSLLMAGVGVDGAYSGVLARLTTNGELDTTFSPGSTPGYQFIAGGAGLEIPSDFEIFDDGRMLAVANGYGAGNTWLFKFDSIRHPDFGGANDWSTQGFGICLRDTTGTAAWTSDGTCNAADGPEWQAVPTAWADVSSATNPNDTGILADFRFGLRTGAATPTGKYSAPIDFEVVAP